MIVELRLKYDEKRDGVRRILGVEFPADKVVKVAPKVAGFVVEKYGPDTVEGVKVEVVSGKPEKWVKPTPPRVRAWDETIRLPQVDPDRGGKPDLSGIPEIKGLASMKAEDLAKLSREQLPYAVVALKVLGHAERLAVALKLLEQNAPEE